MTKTTDADPSGSVEIRQTEDGLSVASADLFRGHAEVVIVHNGARYRLRITRQDKLILTK